jgi:carboxymethylenebutenolidase
MEIRSVEIATPDGSCDAHLAVPEGSGTFPGVLYCMDAFGVRPVIDEWLSRTAERGYVVLAPNLLYRGTRLPIVEDMSPAMSQENRAKIFERIRPMMMQLTPENVVRDASAYLDYLSSLPQVRPGKLGVTGYCMGGRIALLIAGNFPDRIAAAASFHGGNLATDAPESPHLLAPKIEAEVYVAHADHDQGAPPEQQERLADAFSAAGVTYRGELYAEAPHGFTMSDTAAYRREAAERHFEELMALLDRNLRD